MVHSNEDVDEETFDDVYAALKWAEAKGAEYHDDGWDCIQGMKNAFVFEDKKESDWFQYGTDYHWVTFTRVSEKSLVGT